MTKKIKKKPHPPSFLPSFLLSFFLPHMPDQPATTEQEKVQEILKLQEKINLIIRNIRDSKTICDKYESDIQYFQDYIGQLMKQDK